MRSGWEGVQWPHTEGDLSGDPRELPDETIDVTWGDATEDTMVTQERLSELRSDARAAELAARVAEAALRDGALATSVGEAEENLANAEAELKRLEELDDTLTRTLAFLREAEEWAHRTIAPRLNDAVRAMLPAVTGGRYTEVAIDSTNLDVTVWGSGGAARKAAHLSYGTAEQVYLLLRIALAEYLVKDGVSCPLIFDDVTVHADRDRTAAILDLLLAVSDRHQVIVFTQQEQVREWAHQNLAGGRHAIRELEPVTTV